MNERLSEKKVLLKSKISKNNFFLCFFSICKKAAVMLICSDRSHYVVKTNTDDGTLWPYQGLVVTSCFFLLHSLVTFWGNLFVIFIKKTNGTQKVPRIWGLRSISDGLRSIFDASLRQNNFLLFWFNSLGTQWYL